MNRQYDNELNDLIAKSDPLINALEENKRTGAVWNTILIGNPWQQVKNIRSLFKKTSDGYDKFQTVTIPTIAGLGVLTRGAEWLQGHILLNIPEIAGASVFSWYIFTAINTFKKSLDYKNDRLFHAGMYKKFRSQEYAMFRAFADHGLRFQGLKDWVQRSTSKEAVEQIVSTYSSFISEKEKEIAESELNLQLFYKLFSKLTRNIARLGNNQLGPENLDFTDSPYVIYEIKNGVCSFVKEFGTRGGYEPSFDLTDVNFEYIECVKAYNSDELIYAEELEVVSYKVSLRDGATWVITYYIDEHDEWSLELHHGYGILNTQGMYDLIRTHCEILHSMRVPLGR